MFKSIGKKCASWCGTDSALLALRIGVGGIFIFSGWMKVSDSAANISNFAMAGFGPFWAYLVAYVELIGGIAVLLGAYTRIAAKLLTIIMIVAIYKTWGNMAYVMTPIAVFFSTLTLTLAGGGKYSVMKGCCGDCDCKSGTCGCEGGTCEAK